MLQTTTNAPNARALLRKYYPPLGNRTRIGAVEVPAKRADAGCSRLPRSVKRHAAQEVRNERPSVQRRFPFLPPGDT